MSTKRPSHDQIRDQMYDAFEWQDAGKTDVPGMTFEEGVEAALRWVLEGGDAPIENKYGSADDEEETDETD